MNATITASGVGLDTVWVNVSVNNTAETKFIVTTYSGDEYYFNLDKTNYTAHDIVNWTYHANDTLDNLGSGTMQSFTVANQIPTISPVPLLNSTSPKTNDLIKCNAGTFQDDDAEDNPQNTGWKWYKDNVEIFGETLQTLDLSTAGNGNKGEVIKCSERVYDNYDWSNWYNSSNTATIDNTAPTIDNPQTTVSWDANESTYNYDYDATDPDVTDGVDTLIWYDNTTTLFDINSATGVISDTPTEAQAGNYAIRINVSDGTVNATDDFTYTINDVTYPTVSITYPQNTDYIVNVSQLNYKYTETNPDKCWWSNSSGVWNFSLQTCGTNWTDLTSIEGSNTWTVYINDTSGNENSSSVTFNKDTAGPSVSINSPSAQNYTTTTITFNVTATDGGGISSCWYSLDAGTTNTSLTNSAGDYYTDTNSSMTQGYHTANYYCNDTLNNWNNTEQVTFFVDSIIPQISFTTGTEDNATTFARDWIFANVSVIEENEDTITFSLYNQTALANSTSFAGSTRTINWTGLPNEIYYYNVTVNDTSGNENSTETKKIILDTEGPQVSSLTESPSSPADYSESGTYYFNATITDPSLDDVWIDFNRTNYTTNSQGGNIYGFNISDLSVGTYDYRWYANDSFSNINGTENGTYTISQGTPSLNLNVDPTWSETYGTQTNVTGSGCPSQLTCILYRDGIEVSSSDVATLGVKVYNYTYNTSGNANYTSASATNNLTITQNTGSCGVVFNESSGITYPSTFLVWSNCTSTATLYRNGTGIDNNSVQNLAAETYNFTIIRTDNTNYSNIYDERNFVVNQATGVIYTYINNVNDNQSVNLYNKKWLNATLITGSGNIKLYYNDTLINQGASPLANLTNFTSEGEFNVSSIYSGNENYTSDIETWWVNVTLNSPPVISLIYPANTSYNAVQTELNYTVSDADIDACWYSTDGGSTNTTITTCGDNVTSLNSGENSSTWTVYANDSIGQENSDSVTFFVDSITPTIQFESPTETSGSSLGRNYIQVNVTASDENLENITIRLYNSTKNLVRTNISTSSPHFINYTELSAGTYFFNATANDTVGNNISTETRNITLILPTLTIISPENETYITNISLLLNYSVSNENYVWYKVLNSTGDLIIDNTTITSATYFNTTEGSQTLYLYANNTLGEVSNNVTFSVNSSKFKIHYNKWRGSTKGTSTHFNSPSYEDIQNLSGVVLENTQHGRIEFNGAINLTDDEDPTDNQVDISTYTNISSNRIEINSTALPNFNKSATLYLYNLTLDSPVRILRDGSVCSSTICTQQSYTGETLIFNVTQFTVYSAEETPVKEIPGVPSGGAGAPQTPGSGPECFNDTDCTGDEACWNHLCVKLFDIKIIDFESPIKLGEFFDFTYLVKGMADISGDVEIYFWIEKDGEIITSGLDTIYVGDFEEKTETTKIFLPSNIDSGIYDFFVQVSYGAYKAKSYRTIELEISEEGVVTISPIETKGLKTYMIFILIILAALILSFIFYLERKKIKAELMQEGKWIKKHKTSVLTFSLFVVLGILAYYLNLFELTAIWIFKDIFWIKRNVIPYLQNYMFGAIIALVALLILIFIIKNKKKMRQVEREVQYKGKKELKKIKYKSKIRRIKTILRRLFSALSKEEKTTGKFLKKEYKISAKETEINYRKFSKIIGRFIRKSTEGIKRGIIRLRKSLRKIKSYEKEIEPALKISEKREIRKVGTGGIERIFIALSRISKKSLKAIKKRVSLVIKSWKKHRPIPKPKPKKLHVLKKKEPVKKKVDLRKILILIEKVGIQTRKFNRNVKKAINKLSRIKAPEIHITKSSLKDIKKKEEKRLRKQKNLFLMH